MSTEAAIHFPNGLVGETSVAGTESVDAVAPPILQQNADISSDESLLEAVGNGSKDALGLLFHRHGRAIFHVAWRILRNNSEADDLRQEVFLYVFEKAKLFDASKGSAASWIIQIAYHRAIDRRRYLTRRQHYDAPVFDEQQSLVGTAPPSTDQIDGKAILNRLRNTLSADQREALELHFFEGYSLREIAKKNGQSVGNIRHHYYRALERLRTNIFPPKSRLE